MNQRSIVEYFGLQQDRECGYCKSESKEKCSHGMWTHLLTVDDYQGLLDRGWRRSGKYCYKPCLNRTCCPPYTIRCDATQFKLSKSQKRVLKRMHDYLTRNEKRLRSKNLSANSAPADEHNFDDLLAKTSEIPPTISDLVGDSQKNPVENRCALSSAQKLPPSAMKTQPLGLDPSRPLCTKAKLRRKQRHLEKLIAKGLPPVLQKREIPPKTVEQRMTTGENASHSLKVRLVRSHPPSAEFQTTFDESYVIYKKYQIEIHKDTPEKASESGFRRFLCDSPLIPVESGKVGHPGYGSFHQQYFLDGKLVAVGILDILPHCVSSKYFYYDPQYTFLCFGIYSALKEIVLVRELARLEPNLRFYYMGFYIHNCQKMRYKGRYRPSGLLCPEVYTWHPIEKCLPRLDSVVYSRFEQDADRHDQESAESNLNDVLVLHEGALMRYSQYKQLKTDDVDDENEVKEYANLVGKTCARSICLFRE